MSEELKSCPFCEGEALKLGFIRATDKVRWWEVECECGAIMQQATEELVVAAWNTRTDPDTRQLVEQRDALAAENVELRKERDALLERPLNFEEFHSIDDEKNDRMLAFYWCEQAHVARGEQDALAKAVQPLIAVIEEGVSVNISDEEMRSAHPEDRRFIKRTRLALANARAALAALEQRS